MSNELNKPKKKKKKYCEWVRIRYYCDSGWFVWFFVKKLNRNNRVQGLIGTWSGNSAWQPIKIVLEETGGVALTWIAPRSQRQWNISEEEMMNYGSFWQFLHGILEFCSGYCTQVFIILRLPFLWWSSCMTSAWSEIRTVLYGVRIPGSIMISFCFMFIKLDYQSKEQRFSLHLGYWFYFWFIIFYSHCFITHTQTLFIKKTMTTFGSFWPLLGSIQI